ncbi:GNAT family N-acetyltransferase [bacterium 1XD42-8]|jgi:GNAT superfamily N-acetyltransferase|nr:GNAT family N-acetyltransferase [Lachnospiraceae bacterium]RKJ47590.1 GNAT family N-acetyltransferase [bacterium 1XD42-8]
MVQYRKLHEDEIRQELFQDFIRHQIVTKCWRKEGGEWIIKEVPFIEDWKEKDCEILVSCLKNTIVTRGFVYAAFYHGKLKGFVSVESSWFGGEGEYLDLSSIHVSEDMRNKGIGRALFLEAKKWAKKKGAKKLYISAHSSVESQAFYKSMGCIEAKMYNKRHVEEEPYDCQLECRL